MALYSLFRRIPSSSAAATALRPPAAGSRRLMSQFHQSHKAEGHWRSISTSSKFWSDDSTLREEWKTLEDLDKGMDQLQRMCDKEMKLINEELNDFEKLVWECTQQSAQFRKRIRKFADVSAALGVGVFLVAIVARHSL